MSARLVALLLLVTALVSGGIAAGVSWGVASSVAGAAGANGANGRDGVDGTDGTNGVDGQDGAAGATGSTGAAGKPGKDGSASSVGARGATGSAGPVGPQGPQGIQGAPGTNGTNGTNGTDGADGTSAPSFGATTAGPILGGTSNPPTPVPVFTLADPVPQGAALMGFSVTLEPYSVGGGDVVTCDVRDWLGNVYAKTAPLALPNSLDPTTISSTVVATLPLDTGFTLYCTGTIPYSGWWATDISIYAISFAP